MINSRFIENVYTASDKEPKTKNKIRDHFDASCTRISNLSRSVCCAFLQGNSWTRIGIASLSFSFMIPICTLTSLGSLWSATDALIEGARVQNVWCGRYIPEHLRNWQGWHRDRLTCTKEQKILVQKNEHGDGIKFTKIPTIPSCIKLYHKIVGTATQVKSLAHTIWIVMCVMTQTLKDAIYANIICQ